MQYTLGFCVLTLWCCVLSDAWSWDDNSKSEERVVEVQNEKETTVTMKRETNATEIEDVIESILNSGRQGRNIQGYDEIYADPNIQEVLHKGTSTDDPEARNLIRERLCSLGLLQCEEDIAEKRPYISPEELVYAQPVDIKPIGRPIPSIPIKGPSRAIYGPPRPSYPHKNGPQFYNPVKPGYGPPHGLESVIPPRRYGPGAPPKPYGPPRPPPVYASDSFIEVDTPPFEYESSSFYQNKDTKKKFEGAIGPNGEVQQHVHHHYHHNADEDTSVSKIPTSVANKQSQIFKPSESISTTGFLQENYKGSYGGQSIANYGQNGLGTYAAIKPVVEQNIYHNQGPQTFGLSGSLYTQTGVGTSSNNYGQGHLGSSGQGSFGSLGLATNSGFNGRPSPSNSFGASVGSYGSSDFYKKELSLGGQNINNLGGNNFDKYQGLSSENYDCICVPYDQCQNQDVIGRKDDLYLPLDPRNLKTDIVAEEERVITDGNGNMTVIKVKKEASLNATDGISIETQKKTKREATTNSPIEDNNKNANVEARQSQYNTKNIKPTFGVSFGLPQQNSYPINPHYPNLGLQNPYVNQAGINLGLVSLNPLVSVQVTKDDYGEKVIKPFVNLHVTPNNYLVDKVTNLLAYKKHSILNNHFHKHIYKPGYGYGHSHHEPSNYEVPHLPPHDDGAYLEHLPNNFEKPYHFATPNYEGQYHESQYVRPNYGDFSSISGSYEGGYDESFYGRTFDSQHNNTTGFRLSNLASQLSNQNPYGSFYKDYVNIPQIYDSYGRPTKPYDRRTGKSSFQEIKEDHGNFIKFPSNRRRRDVTDFDQKFKRQAYFGQQTGSCGPRHVCCRRPIRPVIPNVSGKQCGVRHTQGINGRIKNPVYVDGDSEFGEYPWQVAILKKDPKESVYICGGTLIDALHIITAAHCVKQYTSHGLRVRLGEWDVNHDVEFYPYIERDVSYVHIHPEFYAGTLYNDLAILRIDKPVDFAKYPHVSPACLPSPYDDYSGTRCWTTGWGKDAFGDFGKYQNILKEVDVPIVGQGECQQKLKHTRLGYEFKLHPGFVCAGGEEGKDACKGDGGGPMVCERGGTWQVVGVVSWGIGCGQNDVPGVYVKVAHYLDWIKQITQRY